MMNRIDRCFEQLKTQGRKGLVGYLTAGDPDMETSERDIRMALDAGVDILELGVPFSDPTADGPVIQAAAQRALASGTSLQAILEMVARLREDYPRQPMVLFGYTNPFFRYGYELLCADAAGVGIDGLLTVDLPFEESHELRQYTEPQDLAFIPLIAPVTPRERMARILKASSGFVYYIMVTGVTGAREALAANLQERMQVLRAVTDLPVAAGFGVGSGAQARAIAAHADAVVVGSALVKAARERRLDALVRELAAALR